MTGYAVIQHASTPEDEGRDYLINTASTRDEAERILAEYDAKTEGYYRFALAIYERRDV